MRLSTLFALALIGAAIYAAGVAGDITGKVLARPFAAATSAR